MTTQAAEDLKLQYLRGIETLIDNNKDKLLESINNLINKKTDKLLPLNTDDILASIHALNLDEDDNNYIIDHQAEWQTDVAKIIMKKLNLLPSEGE